MLIGVLALQGAFREHCKMIESCGAQAREIRKPQQLEKIDGLIIPGGESTTIGKLMAEFELLQPIKDLAKQGLPIYGTCAGMVLMAKDIIGSDQVKLGLMDIHVVRNAYGRQVESFEADLQIDVLGDLPFPAVFIRAPYVERVEPVVGIMAEYQGKVVMARQGDFLVSSFHPELTDDTRIHEYFLQMVEK